VGTARTTTRNRRVTTIDLINCEAQHRIPKVAGEHRVDTETGIGSSDIGPRLILINFADLVTFLTEFSLTVASLIPTEQLESNGGNDAQERYNSVVCGFEF
jgi:hypothetical protein